MIDHTVIGEKGKGVILMLHGFMGSKDSFLGVARLLQKDYQIYLVSMFGFGDTPHPSYPLTIEDYAQSIIELIRFYKLDDLLLVGHSFGGRIAIRVANATDRVNKLILTASAGIKPRRGLGYYYKVLKYKILKRISSQRASKMGSDDYKRMSGFMRKTFINVVNERQEKEAAKLIQPTLLIWGDKDNQTPLYMAKRFNRLIKNSSLIVFSQRGHFAYLEEQVRFAAIVRHFMTA